MRQHVEPTKNKGQQVEGKQRLPYQTPAVIYEGEITTRAGSPTGSGSGNPNGVDPADLFGN